MARTCDLLGVALVWACHEMYCPWAGLDMGWPLACHMLDWTFYGLAMVCLWAGLDMYLFMWTGLG